MSEYSNISENISHEDLLEEYQLLYKKYQEICAISEENAQKKYDLNKALDITKLSNTHLLQEVEEHWKRDYHRMQNELDQLRKHYNKLELSMKTLEDEHKNLIEQRDQLSQQLFSNGNIKVNAIDSMANLNDNEIMKSINGAVDNENIGLDRLQILEVENEALYNKLQEYEECLLRHNQLIIDFEKSKELLEEQKNCLEENLKHNQMELEEKTIILQNAQEQLAEANAKISSLLASNDDNLDRKGNSLFSQVDDQRQALEQLLSTQKKTILDMQMANMESKLQIRRLISENDTIITELNQCSSIFYNVDQSIEEELNNRIEQLLLKNQQLENELELKQQQLKELAIHKKILCLDIYVDMWKKEVKDLKQQLYNVYTENAKLELEGRNVLRDTARWHLESIMARWQIAKRENLLNDNNIPFKPLNDFEFHINDKEIGEARPRNHFNEIKKNESKLCKFPEIKGRENEEENQVCLHVGKVQATQESTSVKNKMEMDIEMEMGMEMKMKVVMENLKDEIHGKENYNITELPLIFYDDENDVEVTMKIITTAITKPLRSILKKQKNLINVDENVKNVTFSKESLINHSVNYCGKRISSPPPPSPSPSLSLSLQSSSSSTSSLSSSSSSVLHDRNKSNLKITRIFINSKKH